MHICICIQAFAWGTNQCGELGNGNGGVACSLEPRIYKSIHLHIYIMHVIVVAKSIFAIERGLNTTMRQYLTSVRL
jgi:hypothetical protein